MYWNRKKNDRNSERIVPQPKGVTLHAIRYKNSTLPRISTSATRNDSQRQCNLPRTAPLWKASRLHGRVALASKHCAHPILYFVRTLSHGGFTTFGMELPQLQLRRHYEVEIAAEASCVSRSEGRIGPCKRTQRLCHKHSSVALRFNYGTTH